MIEPEPTLATLLANLQRALDRREEPWSSELSQQRDADDAKRDERARESRTVDLVVAVLDERGHHEPGEEVKRRRRTVSNPR